MPLVSCKKCGAKVSNEYSHCTNCNAPIARQLETGERKGKTRNSVIQRSFTSPRSPITKSQEPSSFQAKTHQPNIRTWFPFVVSLAIASAISTYLPYSGHISRPSEDLAFWVILLPLNFIILTAYRLVTGKDVKIGKTKYTISRNALMAILGVPFAFLGFVTIGQYGATIGAIIAISVVTVIGYLRKHCHKKR